MKILLIDNGSDYLATIVTATESETVAIMGYPFLPSEFKTRSAAADCLVLSGAQVPVGIDLPYQEDELKALKSLTKPVLGIGKGAALLLEAFGGKVRSRDGYEVKKVPAGFTERDGAWRNDRGLVLILEPKDVRTAVSGFLASVKRGA